MSDAIGAGSGTTAGTTAGGAVGARIVDRGYQHYTGKRLAPSHAWGVMVRAALRRAMGIRRSGRAKIAPWGLTVVAYAPTLILLGLRFLLPISGRLPLPGYNVLLSNTVILFVLFAGLAAPDLLCADRRERVLSLLFASPITRLLYVGAQVAALTILLLLLTLLPMLLLFAGNALLADAAGAYVRDHLGDLWHITLSGGLLALYYSAVAMAVASFTDRRAYATGAFLGLMLVSGVVANVLTRVMRTAGHEWFALLDLVYLPLRLVYALFGGSNLLYPRLGNDAVTLAATLGVIVVSLALTSWRYQRVRD